MPKEFDFEKFLADQRVSKSTHGNLSSRKDRWLEKVTALYELVGDLLRPYTSTGMMTLRRSTVEISEEPLGTYSIDSLIIDLGGSDVRFMPIGTYLLGSPGRVDLVGLKGSVRFVLVLPDLDEPRISITSAQGHTAKHMESQPLDISRFEWKISTLPPRIKYRKIDATSLQAAIVEAANGKHILG